MYTFNRTKEHPICICLISKSFARVTVNMHQQKHKSDLTKQFPQLFCKKTETTFVDGKVNVTISSLRSVCTHLIVNSVEGVQTTIILVQEYFRFIAYSHKNTFFHCCTAKSLSSHSICKQSGLFSIW